MTKDVIYLDNCATTMPHPEVTELVAKISAEQFYNPSALYKQASDCALMVRKSREYLKSTLHAPDGELYFVSGGTEADNTALFCTRKPKGSRIIVGEGEHDAVINCAKELKEQGFDVQFAPINADGSVNEDAFLQLLNDKVSLVSIMHVSNETGAINDIAKLSKMVKRVAPNAIFHSDGVQAYQNVAVNLSQTMVDLYSISAHKVHGPKGIGALWVKKGVHIRPFVYGGGQEKGFRSGTENLTGIAGFCEAVRIDQANFAQYYSQKQLFKEYFLEKLTKNVEDFVTITPTDNSSPHILTLAFGNVRGEVLLHSLENDGILVGIGSACSSHRESRFKSLLGLDAAHRDGIVRFSFSHLNDVSQVDFIVERIAHSLATLRNYTRI